MGTQRRGVSGRGTLPAPPTLFLKSAQYPLLKSFYAVRTKYHRQFSFNALMKIVRLLKSLFPFHVMPCLNVS